MNERDRIEQEVLNDSLDSIWARAVAAESTVQTLAASAALIVSIKIAAIAIAVAVIIFLIYGFGFPWYLRSRLVLSRTLPRSG